MIYKPCPLCGKIIPNTEKYCEKCAKIRAVLEDDAKKEYYKRYNNNRYNNEDEEKVRKFYNSKEWINLRDYIYKKNNYLCAECLKQGIYTKANVIHHLIPVKQNWYLRLIPDNLIPLCTKHHNEYHKKLNQDKHNI